MWRGVRGVGFALGSVCDRFQDGLESSQQKGRTQLSTYKVAAGDKLPKFAKKWWVLGPFASGKVEYEAVT